jgi:pimeloyl-ACP methyl ester carboxylesterase
MSKIIPHTIDTLGAKLYYEVQGSGPLLLMLAGGSGSADSFNALVPYLEQGYTVVTYDRRGYARSPLDNPEQVGVVSIETQCADVERLLAELDLKPAYVFGSSFGALVAIELLQRNAQQLQHVVAHEPQLTQLLPSDAAADLEYKPNEAPEETLRRFAASLGVKRSGLHGKGKQSDSHHASNDRFFLEHEAPAVGDYRANFTELAKLKNKLTFAGGSEGREYFPYQCARLAADQIKASFVEFPGKHNGFGVYPEEFANVLKSLLIPLRQAQSRSTTCFVN